MVKLVQIEFDAERAAQSLNQTTEVRKTLFYKAISNTTEEGGKKIEDRAGRDILRAGKFSSRWPEDFIAEVKHPDKARSTISTYFRTIFFGHIHEFGGVVKGKPLLWIPLSFRPELKGVWARDFPGPLFRIDREGKNPLLVSKGGPMYVGVKQVTLKPRFNIRKITANVVRTEFARAFHAFINKA